MSKGFASTGDMAEKKISFTEVGRDLYAFTAEGDHEEVTLLSTWRPGQGQPIPGGQLRAHGGGQQRRPGRG